MKVNSKILYNFLNHKIVWSKWRIWDKQVLTLNLLFTFFHTLSKKIAEFYSKPYFKPSKQIQK